jgi:hypothetical protein
VEVNRKSLLHVEVVKEDVKEALALVEAKNNVEDGIKQ